MLSKTIASRTVIQLSKRALATSNDVDYAFEMASSNIKYGAGATREIGPELANLKVKNVLVVTDKKLSKLKPVQTVIESLENSKIKYTLYDKARVEPTDESFLDCIGVARGGDFDAFVGVGGGSAIDTCKAANLYSCYPDAHLLDFVNAPIGKATPIQKQLKPLIAIPTTAGTGSETTGVSIFDYLPMKAKTGIASRALKPVLGIVDPENNASTPPAVRASCGLDVFCHAIESFTAIPYNQRSPRPTNPLLRPTYQGSNPISDIWSLKALQLSYEYLLRSVQDPSDFNAQSQMLLASTYAGIGFGNAGVHICHALSYPISGLNKSYIHKGYDVDHKLVPHGISVVITSPSVFKHTAHSDPERHLTAAKLIGANVTNAKQADAGLILSDAIRKYLQALDVPNGIKAFGFTSSDIPALVKGALPQQRVLKVAPIPVTEKELTSILEESLEIY